MVSKFSEYDYQTHMGIWMQKHTFDSFVWTDEFSVNTNFDKASSPTVVVAKMNIQAPFVQICKMKTRK